MVSKKPEVITIHETTTPNREFLDFIAAMQDNIDIQIHESMKAVERVSPVNNWPLYNILDEIPKCTLPVELGNDGKPLPKHMRSCHNDINSNRNRKKKKKNKTKRKLNK